MAKEKYLISHIGANRKIIINLQVAEQFLDANLKKELNTVLNKLNLIQEVTDFKEIKK
jgi:hypothetical protein